MANLFCMICDEEPCQCKSSSKRRVSKPTTSVRRQPQPVQQEPEPVDTAIRAARTRKVQAPPEVEPVEQVLPEVMARDLRPSDLDETEDFELIEATRVLAHLVVPRDLVAFKEHLAPSDYLPPEDRRADWLKRVHRGATDGSPA